MFDWLKFRKKQASTVKTAKVVKPTRDELVATAMKNMQQTRDIIGEEKLQKLANMILQKQNIVDDTSPAVQAKKIIAQMDKDKLNNFMRLMVQDDQTKH
jgi:hypothetical protein